VATPARPLADGIELALKVIPRAGRTMLAGVERDAGDRAWLVLRLAAPPVEGEANAALLRFLADRLGVSVSACRLVAGTTGRRERVRITGEPDRLLARFEALAAGASS
jgi:uncharacterized protein YggU (UPF0235/DUF167 family)